jgi:hypothetical protein
MRSYKGLIQKWFRKKPTPRRNKITTGQSTEAGLRGLVKISTLLIEVDQQIGVHNAKQSEQENFLELLDSRDELLTEFDEALWLRSRPSEEGEPTD